MNKPSQCSSFLPCLSVLLALSGNLRENHAGQKGNFSAFSSLSFFFFCRSWTPTQTIRLFPLPFFFFFSFWSAVFSLFFPLISADFFTTIYPCLLILRCCAPWTANHIIIKALCGLLNTWLFFYNLSLLFITVLRNTTQFTSPCLVHIMAAFCPEGEAQSNDCYSRLNQVL